MNKDPVLDQQENVLVLQGGGPSGAFGCGVLKALVRRKIKIDIIAATSSGAINAAIFGGSKDEKHPEKNLEEFWLDISGNSSKAGRLFERKIAQERQNFGKIYLEGIRASPPIANLRGKGLAQWNMGYTPTEVGFFPSMRNLIEYDNRHMLKVAEKYINYKRLTPTGNQKVRILLTAVDVLTCEPLIFDGYKMQITPLHLLAVSGYQQPVPNVQVNNGIYAWDGSLLSATPLREVMVASPNKNKNVFVLENYAKRIEKLPANISEVMSRTKDIIFSDKTQSLAKMSRLTTRQVNLIETLYDVFQNSSQSKISKEKIEFINREHSTLVEKHGAQIKSYVTIGGTGRSKESSRYTDLQSIVKEDIRMGESKTLSLIDNGIIKSQS